MRRKTNAQETMFDNCTILFRNFAGKPSMYNKEGDRNFCVLLDPEQAARMEEDGWNVKLLRPRDPDDEPQPYIKVKVNFGGRPPTIVLMTSRGRASIPEALAPMVDFADIAKVDLIIRPYEWDVNGREGVTAYLKSIYITIHEDALELRYAHIPEIGSPEQLALSAGEQQAWDYEGEVVEEEFQRALGR